MKHKPSIDLATRIIDLIRERQLAAPGQTVVVAVSGGPDSVCLLHILARHRADLGITIHAAHLDHMLRGQESSGDAAYVRKLAAELDVPLTVEETDVRAYQSGKHIPVEEAAREVRYRFLGKVARETGAAAVAVGHTRDDQVETILMHILRGAGTWGLTGLQLAGPLVTRENPAPIYIIRPLLEVPRADTASYCASHGLTPRLDSSNLLPDVTRNRIRLELLPILREYNPAVDDALLKLAAVAADDSECIKGFARGIWDLMAVSPGPLEVRLPKDLLAREPVSLRRELLKMAVARLLGSARDFTHQNLVDMQDLVEAGAGKKIALPHHLVFRTEHDCVVLARSGAEDCPFPPLEETTPLNIPGVTSVPGWNIRADIASREIVTASEPMAASFDFASTGAMLTVSKRLPGDRFQPLGLEQPKKLQDFFVDSAVPAAWRDRVPLVRSGESIIWVVGWRIAQTARVTGSTRNVLTIRFERADQAGLNEASPSVTAPPS